MLADYHTHTAFCRHADGEIPGYVDAARRAGLEEMAFTDHVPAPDGYDPSNRMALDTYPQYAKAVGAVAGDREGVRVLYGLEADYYEGGVPFLAGFLARHKLDLVIGSVHYIRGWGFDDPAERGVWESVDVTQAWREYFVLLAKLADTRLFDVVAHLDLPKKFGYRPTDAAVREMAAPALDRIAAAGMGVELNTSGLRRPVKEIYPSPMLLSMCRERGIPIGFGSDAHTPADVGSAFDKAVALAKGCGYTECMRFRGRQRRLVPLA